MTKLNHAEATDKFEPLGPCKVLKVAVAVVHWQTQIEFNLKLESNTVTVS
jgi:hypothetical protein